MSNMHSPCKQVLVKPSLSPKVRTADTNGLGVDCRGYRRALVIFHLGVHDRADGDETTRMVIQESSDDGSSDPYADVTNGVTATLGAVTPNSTSGNVYLVEVDLTKRKRYLRANLDVGGTTPSDACSTVILLFDPTQASVSQDATPVIV